MVLHALVVTLITVSSLSPLPAMIPAPTGMAEAASTGQVSPETDLSKLPLLDLIHRQPLNAWEGGRDAKLRPEVLELLHRAGSGKWSDEDWRTALTASGMIRTRSKWPVGVPLQIAIGSQEWLRMSKITVRVVEPDLGQVSFDDLVPSMCGNCANADQFRAEHLPLAPLPPETTLVRFEITVIQDNAPERVWGDSEHSPRLLWKGRMERPIQVVPTTSDVLPLTNSPQDTESIRDSLRAFWSTATADPDELIIFVGGTPRELGLSLAVELWRGTEKLRSGSLVAFTERGMIGVERCSGYTELPGLLSTLRVPDVDLSNWELRVRGDPTGVPGLWDAERWWNGSFSISLADLLKEPEKK